MTTDDLVAFVTARLDEEEALAMAACDGDRTTGTWKLHEHPADSALVWDGRGDTVVHNEGLPGEGVAAYIAWCHPARALSGVTATRALLAEILAIPHLYVEGDSWFSCSQARTEWDEDAEPGSGCSNEDRAGKPCDCGRDAKVARMAALIAARWTGRPASRSGT